MKTNGTVELYYDPDNKQIDYQYIALPYHPDDDKGEVVGYLVIEKPYYSAEIDWVYWIYYNKYYNEDNVIEKVLIDPATLRPYTQTESIKETLKNFNVSLKKRFYLFPDEEPEDNLVAFIECQTELPNLWRN